MIDARSDRFNTGMQHNKPLRVIVCLVTLVAFFVSTFSYDLARAAEGAPSSASTAPKKILSVRTFTIPEDMGHIKEACIGSGTKTVIQIQDAHCNYAAQKKVAEIIEYINTEYDVSAVNLEGGAKDYDLSIFTDIADRAVREKTADYFVKEGLVNGAEYFAINNPEKVSLWGVEDPALYMENLNVYRNSLSHKDETEKSLKSLGYILSNLKIKIYSKELLEFDKRYSQYKANNIEFKEYLGYIFAAAKEKAVDIKAFRNISLLNKALQEEASIDFSKANNERDSLIDMLHKKLSRNSMEELVVKTIEFKTGKVSQKDFYAYLLDKAKKTGLDLSGLGELKKYVIYIAAYDAIDKMKVMDELDGLEAKIKDAMIENSVQRDLSTLSKNLALLKNIFDISITRDDYRYYKANEDAFAVRNFASFIEKEALLVLGASLRGREAAEAISKSGLDQYRDEITKFYECSFKRDKAFVKNIRLADSVERIAYSKNLKMDNDPDNILNAERYPLNANHAAILITGGFHTDNLCEIFRKEGISYISIIPVFKNDAGYQSPYFGILSGKEEGLVGQMRAALSPTSSMQVPSPLSSAIAEKAWSRVGIDAFRAAVKDAAALTKMAIKENWGRINKIIVRGKSFVVYLRDGPPKEILLTDLAPKPVYVDGPKALVSRGLPELEELYPDLEKQLKGLAPGSEVLLIGPGQGFEILDILRDPRYAGLGLKFSSVGRENFFSDDNRKDLINDIQRRYCDIKRENYKTDNEYEKAMEEAMKEASEEAEKDFEMLKNGFRRADMDEELPYRDKTFDAVIFGSHVMDYSKNRISLIQKIYNILRPGGIGIIDLQPIIIGDDADDVAKKMKPENRNWEREANETVSYFENLRGHSNEFSVSFKNSMYVKPILTIRKSENGDTIVILLDRVGKDKDKKSSDFLQGYARRPERSTPSLPRNLESERILERIKLLRRGREYLVIGSYDNLPAVRPDLSVKAESMPSGKAVDPIVRNTGIDGLLIENSWSVMRSVSGDDVSSLKKYFIVEKGIATCSALMLRVRFKDKAPLIASIHIPPDAPSEGRDDQVHRSVGAWLDDLVQEGGSIEAVFLNPSETIEEKPYVSGSHYSINNLVYELKHTPAIRAAILPPLKNSFALGTLTQYSGIVVREQDGDPRVYMWDEIKWDESFGASAWPGAITKPSARSDEHLSKMLEEEKEKYKELKDLAEKSNKVYSWIKYKEDLVDAVMAGNVRVGYLKIQNFSGEVNAFADNIDDIDLGHHAFGNIVLETVGKMFREELEKEFKLGDRLRIYNKGPTYYLIFTDAAGSNGEVGAKISALLANPVFKIAIADEVRDRLIDPKKLNRFTDLKKLNEFTAENLNFYGGLSDIQIGRADAIPNAVKLADILTIQAAETAKDTQLSFSRDYENRKRSDLSEKEIKRIVKEASTARKTKFAAYSEDAVASVIFAMERGFGREFETIETSIEGSYEEGKTLASILQRYRETISSGNFREIEAARREAIKKIAIYKSKYLKEGALIFKWNSNFKAVVNYIIQNNNAEILNEDIRLTFRLGGDEYASLYWDSKTRVLKIYMVDGNNIGATSAFHGIEAGTALIWYTLGEMYSELEKNNGLEDLQAELDSPAGMDRIRKHFKNGNVMTPVNYSVVKRKEDIRVERDDKGKIITTPRPYTLLDDSGNAHKIFINFNEEGNLEIRDGSGNDIATAPVGNVIMSLAPPFYISRLSNNTFELNAYILNMPLEEYDELRKEPGINIDDKNPAEKDFTVRIDDTPPAVSVGCVEIDTNGIRGESFDVDFSLIAGRADTLVELAKKLIKGYQLLNGGKIPPYNTMRIAKPFIATPESVLKSLPEKRLTPIDIDIAETIIKLSRENEAFAASSAPQTTPPAPTTTPTTVIIDPIIASGYREKLGYLSKSPDPKLAADYAQAKTEVERKWQEDPEWFAEKLREAVENRKLKGGEAIIFQSDPEREPREAYWTMEDAVLNLVIKTGAERIELISDRGIIVPDAPTSFLANRFDLSSEYSPERLEVIGKALRNAGVKVGLHHRVLQQEGRVDKESVDRELRALEALNPESGYLLLHVSATRPTKILEKRGRSIDQVVDAVVQIAEKNRQLAAGGRQKIAANIENYELSDEERFDDQNRPLPLLDADNFVEALKRIYEGASKLLEEKGYTPEEVQENLLLSATVDLPHLEICGNDVFVELLKFYRGLEELKGPDGRKLPVRITNLHAANLLGKGIRKKITDTFTSADAHLRVSDELGIIDMEACAALIKALTGREDDLPAIIVEQKYYSTPADFDKVDYAGKAVNVGSFEAVRREGEKYIGESSGLQNALKEMTDDGQKAAYQFYIGYYAAKYGVDGAEAKLRQHQLKMETVRSLAGTDYSEAEEAIRRRYAADRFAKNYPPGTYCTTVTVAEGAITVAEYDETGIITDTERRLSDGESITIVGKVAESAIIVHSPDKTVAEYPIGTYSATVSVFEGKVSVTTHNEDGTVARELSLTAGQKALIDGRIVYPGTEDYGNLLNGKGEALKKIMKPLPVSDDVLPPAVSALKGKLPAESRLPATVKAYAAVSNTDLDPIILIGLPAEWKDITERPGQLSQLKLDIGNLLKNKHYGAANDNHKFEFFFMSKRADIADTAAEESINDALAGIRRHDPDRKVVLFARGNVNINNMIEKDKNLIVQKDEYTDLAFPDINARIAAGRLIAYCSNDPSDLGTFNVLKAYMEGITGQDMNKVENIHDLLNFVIKIMPIKIDKEFGEWERAMIATATAA